MDDAIDKLLDLSPFDLKHLLLLIFSSKEFTVDESEFSLSLLPSLFSPFPLPVVLMSVILPSFLPCVYTVKCRESLIIEGQIMNLPTKQLSIVASSKKRAHGKLQKDVKVSAWPQYNDIISTIPLSCGKDTSPFHLYCIGAWYEPW